ncbi:MAG: S41 family peptidase [Bacilli bacterium]|jgi:hypothetical protein|nr:S41 family peptidase [Bacilli bacterium]
MKKSWVSLLSLFAVISLVSCQKPASAASTPSSVASVTSVTSPETSPSTVSPSQTVSVSTVPTFSVTNKDVDCYWQSVKNKTTVSLSFINGQNDIPFLEMTSAADLFSTLLSLMISSKYEATLTSQDALFTISVDNGASAVIDFNKKSLTYHHFAQFFQNPGTESVTDVLSYPGFDADGKATYFERETEMTSERLGTELKTLNLNDWKIPLYYQNGKGYLPLQTFTDCFISIRPVYLAYNGQSLFLGSDSISQYDFADLYYSVQAGPRSQPLADFTYQELVFELDNFYGLKSLKKIDSFDTYLTSLSLKDDLLSTDGLVADKALNKLAYSDLADIHTKYLSNSPYAGKASTIPAKDYYSPDYADFYNRYVSGKTNRAAAYGSEVPSYEQVGDTAIITFDTFTGATSDYYATAPTSATKDTMGLVSYAHSEITKAGDTVKNVVLDLSCNTGGEANAAIYILGWFLGTAVVPIENTFGGDQAINVYKTDINLDHTFDDNDTLGSRHLYCLTSRVSFSCGNLVPCLFKGSGKVSLIGQPSGGGSCSVAPISLADGTLFRISSTNHLSTVKNGTFYDIDEGAEPDHAISDLSFLYSNKRQDFVTYLDSLH